MKELSTAKKLMNLSGFCEFFEKQKKFENSPKYKKYKSLLRQQDLLDKKIEDYYNKYKDSLGYFPVWKKSSKNYKKYKSKRKEQ